MNSYDVAIYLLEKVIRLATVSEELLGETCFRDLIYIAETDGRTELIEPADKLFDLAGELHVTIEPVKKLAEEMKREYQRIQRGAAAEGKGDGFFAGLRMTGEGRLIAGATEEMVRTGS